MKQRPDVCTPLAFFGVTNWQGIFVPPPPPPPLPHTLYSRPVIGVVDTYMYFAITISTDHFFFVYVQHAGMKFLIKKKNNLKSPLVM